MRLRQAVATEWRLQPSRRQVLACQRSDEGVSIAVVVVPNRQICNHAARFATATLCLPLAQGSALHILLFHENAVEASLFSAAAARLQRVLEALATGLAAVGQAGLLRRRLALELQLLSR